MRARSALVIVTCFAASGLAAAAAPASSATPDAPVGPARLLLGPGRALVLDWCWWRAEVWREQGRGAELPPLYRTIAALDPQNPAVWIHHADVLGLDLVVAAGAEPDGGWRLAAEALDLLLAGLRRNPGTERLRLALAWHLLVAAGADRPAIFRARAADRFGRDPLVEVDALMQAVRTAPDHRPLSDMVRRVALRRLAAEAAARGEDVTAFEAAIAELTAHLATAHGVTGEDDAPAEDRG